MGAHNILRSCYHIQQKQVPSDEANSIVTVHFTIDRYTNSHVLTGTNTCINKAIHVLLMHGFFYFRYTVSSTITKTDVINSNVHRSKHN